MCVRYDFFSTVTEETLRPPQDVMPVTSDNPADDSIHNLKLKESSTNSITNTTKDSYENIEEVYFKESRTDIEGVYEPI